MGLLDLDPVLDIDLDLCYRILSYLGWPSRARAGPGARARGRKPGPGPAGPALGHKIIKSYINF